MKKAGQAVRRLVPFADHYGIGLKIIFLYLDNAE